MTSKALTVIQPKAKLTIDADDLAEACKRARWIIPRRSTVPAIEHMHVDATSGNAVFTATDGQTAIKFKIAAKGDGPMLLPARLIAKQLGGSTGEVTYAVDGNEIVRRSASRIFRHPLVSVADFPTIDLGKYVSAFTIDLDSLGWCFQQTEPCMAGDGEPREYLRGVHMSFDTFEGTTGIFFAATDGERLARAGLPEARPLLASMRLSKIKATIPSAAVRALLKLMYLSQPDENDDVLDPVTVRQYANAVTFEGPGWTLTTKPVTGEFPQYQRIVPKQTEIASAATFDAPLLQEAAARVATVASVHSPIALKFLPKAGKLNLSMKGDGADSDEDVGATVKGKMLTVGIRAAFLIRALHCVKARAEIAVSKPTAPVRINDPEFPDFLQVFMPAAIETPLKALPAPTPEATPTEAATPAKPIKSPKASKPKTPKKKAA